LRTEAKPRSVVVIISKERSFAKVFFIFFSLLIFLTRRLFCVHLSVLESYSMCAILKKKIEM